MEIDEKDGGLFVVLLHFDLFLLVPFKISQKNIMYLITSTGRKISDFVLFNDILR